MSSVWAPAESRAPAPIENQTVSVRSQAVRLTAAAERRGEHAYTRAQNAVDRADRPKERARGARRPRIAAELERGRAEPALDLEQRRRGQLEKDSQPRNAGSRSPRKPRRLDSRDRLDQDWEPHT